VHESIKIQLPKNS